MKSPFEQKNKKNSKTLKYHFKLKPNKHTILVFKNKKQPIHTDLIAFVFNLIYILW